jgi:hypothetical protein
MLDVVWLQSALDELATMWIDATPAERQAITAATEALDGRLARNARNEGESRPGGRRITFVPPLAVRFQIEANGQTVSVLHVRLYRKRSP